jgi:hypothetical protein
MKKADPHQRCLVIGLAKSGTTVISSTIKKSLGLPAFYMEKKHAHFFTSKKVAASSAMVKLLFEDWVTRPNILNAIVANEFPVKFQKSVAIIRDPRDVILSFLLWRSAIELALYQPDKIEPWLDVLRRKETHPQELTLVDLHSELSRILSKPIQIRSLRPKLQKYNALITRWRDKPLHVVRYEDFIDGNHKALEAYLGTTITDDRDPGIFVNVPRSKSHGNWKSFFTPKDVTTCRQIFGTILTDGGYEDTGLTPVDSLSPDLFSRYVEKVFHAIKDRNPPKG